MGPTGTGKTTLAGLVARGAGTRLLLAGVADEQGMSATSRERLSSLVLGQRLLTSGADIVLFDEMEDLFGRLPEILEDLGGRSEPSKQWFNRLLETNAVPTIWIANSVEGVDPAYLRRFTYVVPFPPAGARVRARVLTRHLGADALPPGDVDALAARFESSPAQWAGAVATARLVDGAPSRPLLERLLAPSEKLAHGSTATRPAPFDPSRFRLDGVHASQDLVELADRLACWSGGPPGVTLCLHGLPGTGKTEYARYLAWRMQRSVVQRRASDLVSKWVGDTERHVAAAFAEAADDGSLLLVDEADSFLGDRGRASQHWEISAVNEFLQQLECFPGVVVCTTNLLHAVDEAALRRFVFKVEFRPARVQEAVALFEARLGSMVEGGPVDRDLLRGLLGRIPALTAGDFAAVARHQAVLGGTTPVAVLVERLGQEARLRRAPPASAGFRVGMGAP